MVSRYIVKVILVLGLVSAGLFGAGSMCRSSCGKEVVGNNDFVSETRGRWRAVETGRVNGLSVDRATIEMLEAVDYVDGHDRGAGRGVTVHFEDKCSAGINLVLSGHQPGAVLINMEGRVLHRWQVSSDRLWPGVQDKKTNRRDYWRRASVLEGGDLVALYETLGMVKVDCDSRILWMKFGGFHHDFEVLADGRILVLDRTIRKTVFEDKTRKILDDQIVLLSRDGEVLPKTSLLEAFRASQWSSMLPSLEDVGDPLHTNSLELVDRPLGGRRAEIREGQVLLSFRTNSAIGVFDLESKKFVWMHQGSWKQQHSPTVLEDGRIALFDNSPASGRSRIVIVDPRTGHEEVVFEGTEAHPFFSETCGMVQELNGGNLLVTETDRGRAFELTASGKIVVGVRQPMDGRGESRSQCIPA